MCTSLKRGVYSLGEHALRHGLVFRTFIEGKKQKSPRQRSKCDRAACSLLFIDCFHIVCDYIISTDCSAPQRGGGIWGSGGGVEVPPPHNLQPVNS